MTEVPTHTQIFKVFRTEGWETLQRDGRTRGSALDRADGFIHLSALPELQGTLDKYYADVPEIVLAEVSLAALSKVDLRWEPSRGGALFPHIYGALPLSAITRHWTLRPQADGRYALPDFDEDARP